MAKVRISVANVAMSVRKEGKLVRHPFGILNQEKLEKGERQYKAFGRVVMLSDIGKQYLQKVFHATDFEVNAKAGFFEARFKVEEEYVGIVLDTFANIEGIIKGLEVNRAADFIKKLSSDKEFPEFGCTSEEAEMILPFYMKSVRQNPVEVGTDTSERALDIPTYRLFRVYELIMPINLFDRFVASPRVRFFTSDELATTCGGSKAGITSNGCVMQNNLFLV